MKIIKLLVVILVVIVGAAFSAINADIVMFNYYFGQIELPLAILLISSIILGAILGILASLSGIIRAKHDANVLKREVKLVEQEVHNLRKIPVKD